MSIASTVRFYRFQLIIALATISVLFSDPSPAALLVDLDATVFESVSGNPVTLWRNQAGNQHHATISKGTILFPGAYKSATGLPGLDFTGGCNQMDIMTPVESQRVLDLSNGTGGFAVMIVFTDLSSMHNPDNWSTLIGNCSFASNGFFVRYHARDKNLRFSLAGNHNIGKVSQEDTVLVGLNYDADSGVATATMITSSGNRETINAMVPAQDFSANAPLSIGNAISPTRHMEGLLHKVMIYDNELSEANFAAEMQRLEQIWIAPGSAPISQMNTAPPQKTRIASSNQLPTILVDLDATVSSSISGNPVTEWTDQSGNQFHATPIEGTVRYPSAYVSASGLIGIDFSGETSQMKIMDPAESKRLLDFSNRTGGFSIMMAYTDRPNRDSLSDASNLIANCDSSKKGFFIRLQDKTNELKFSLAKKELIGVIADGDTLVVGLNYDADTGLYTAKMTTSSGAENTITGTIRPKDFSNNNDLFLGNTSHTQRKLEGMIGKVLIYEDELSEADFLDKMQLLAQIWINPKAKTLGLLLF